MSEDINRLLSKQPLLLFDGECGFCNKVVQFFLRNEKKNLPDSKTVKFVPLESEAGKLLRQYFEIDDQIDSIILIRHHSAYIKSCAALRLTQYMKGLWPVLSLFVIIPPFIRNLVYNFVAKHRKKIAGRVESCGLLKQEDKERFLLN
jgi:predicted DCC family thiol-disulfide oxidoreductase YuxK